MGSVAPDYEGLLSKLGDSRGESVFPGGEILPARQERMD